MMKGYFIISAALGSLLLFSPARQVFAEPVAPNEGRDAQVKAITFGQSGVLASPNERRELTRQFVRKWGPYVQRTYGIPVAVWAARMAPNFAKVDGDNFRHSLNQQTFEGAVAQLNGRSGRFLSTNTGRLSVASSAKALGSLTADLVYTPIAPCRIVDTRNMAAGAISANGTRSFLGINAVNFSAQGGSSTDCGTSGVNAAALALNVTAVLPSIAGYATVYPYGAAQPAASSLNYGAGAIVNNLVIAAIPNPLSTYDFTLYSYSQSHYVIDIVGYFAPPIATEFSCEDTDNVIVSVAPGASASATANACPVGYSTTTTNCDSASTQMPLISVGAGVCKAQNNSATPANLSVSRTCCRVPGR